MTDFLRSDGKSDVHAFLTGGGELGTLIAAFDWQLTPLGPIEGWASSLKTTISIILRSPVPIVTLWGEPGVMIYNDAYSEFAGVRHPKLLGSNVREGWEEVADFNDNVMKVCLGGGTLAYRDQELTLHRAGRPRQTWLNLDYSPVLDETGTPIGVIAIVVETTEKVMAERWLRSERERLRNMFEQAPGFIAMLRGPEHVFDLANPAYFQLVGHRDILGKTVRQALPEVEGQGFFELLDDVYITGKPFTGVALPLSIQRTPGAAIEERFIDLVYQPVRNQAGNIIGIFAQGTDVTDAVLAEEMLNASEERNRQILDSAIDYAIIAMDQNGLVTRWNKGAHRILGWSEEEMLGRTGECFYTPEDRAGDRMHLEMQSALDRGVGNDQRWHVRNSGERFWANGEMTLIHDPAGSHIGFVKVLRDRTAEHLAEQSLKESEDRLRRAQEAGGVGLFSLNIDDNVLRVTSEFCRIFGLPESETIHAGVVEQLIVEEDRGLASSNSTRASETAVGNTEYMIRRFDTNDRRVIARRAEFEHDDTGKPTRFVGVVQDITERRFEQRAVRESEAKFRALAQALPNHVWTSPPDGQLDWFNERVYQYSGTVPGDLDDGNWISIVHPDDVGAAAKKWGTAIAFGSTYETEFRLRRADGAYRWHIARAIPIKDEADTTIYWVGTNTDVEDLRATREALTHLNETLEHQVAERTADRDRMWRLSTDIMLVADFSANIIATNPAWTLILGWDVMELVGQSFMELVHPDDRAATLAEVSTLSEGVRTFTFVNRYQHKDGSYRILSWTAVPDDQFIHAVGRDVTDEREAAAALRRTEAALQQAQKMESIGNLTGGVAHDFNNLLQVVSGNLQLLAKDISGNERAERRVSSALSAVDRGSKLASQLLAFGRRQALEPKVVNIGRFVSGMDDMLRRTIGEAIEIETIVSGGLWNTLVDPTQIENAILNLAINARDAMGGAGKLTIEAGNAYLDDAYVRNHDDIRAGQYVVLSVTDTGSGMTPDIVAKVFEPFFSTKPEGKGTGLGLSMVYGFVRQSGGHVKVYSEVGHGTTMKIYLPRSAQKEDIAVAHDLDPIVGGIETILVAEDDDGVRATVVEMLADLGYKVLKAVDAASALSVVESGVAIDLLFTDVVMPGTLKSPELARKAQVRLPNLAVLFTSGYTENSIVHGGRLDQGVQLLSKPYTREQLARKVRHVLANRAQRTLAVGSNGPAQTDAVEVAVKTFDVLLVEDDMLIRMNTADMLADLGHRVLEAGSGEEALDLLAKEHVDVLLTDRGLPKMSGDELAAEARALRPDLAIVFATGDTNAPDIAGAKPALLAKPYNLADVERALKKVTGIED